VIKSLGIGEEIYIFIFFFPVTETGILNSSPKLILGHVDMSFNFTYTKNSIREQKINIVLVLEVAW
jgi:hypothetical protein